MSKFFCHDRYGTRHRGIGNPSLAKTGHSLRFDLDDGNVPALAVAGLGAVESAMVNGYFINNHTFAFGWFVVGWKTQPVKLLSPVPSRKKIVAFESQADVRGRQLMTTLALNIGSFQNMTGTIFIKKLALCSKSIFHLTNYYYENE